MSSEILYIAVREATPDDAEAADEVSRLATEDLRKVYRPSGPPPDLGPMRRLVAEIEGRVVGAVRYTFEDHRLRVIGLTVHPDHRRRGVARRLIDELVRLGEAVDAGRLSLFTIRETGNAPVFERLGFRVVRKAAATDAVSVSGEPLTDVYMERPVGHGKAK